MPSPLRGTTVTRVRAALYQWFERHRWAGDGILAAAFFIALLVSSFTFGSTDRDVVPILLVSAAPLLVRRTQPEIALVAGCLVLLGNVAQIGSLTPAVLLAPVLVHAAVAYSSSRVWGRVALAAGLVGSVLGPIRWSYSQWDRTILTMSVGACALSVVAAFIVGERQRDRREHQAEQVRTLTERAALLAAERDQRGRAAAATERTRIARELHDIVAHSLSVVIVQADGAAAAVAVRPELAPIVLQTIAETSREALAEMRRLVGVLRDPDAAGSDGYVPAQGVRDLDALADQVRAAGIEVRLVVTGVPQPLSAGLDLTVYRLVQEALTNVLKHVGPAARAQVALDYGRKVLRVGVVDDGRGAALTAGTDGTTAAFDGPADGHGLLGMRERVWLQGGRVSAGPQAGGGFRVEATFPLPVRPNAAAGR